MVPSRQSNLSIILFSEHSIDVAFGVYCLELMRHHKYLKISVSGETLNYGNLRQRAVSDKCVIQ